jgi:ABC-type nitrate/sulfonate/bicarbonate transport system substrate-binding protein
MQSFRQSTRRLVSLGAFFSATLAMLASWSCSANVSPVRVGTTKNEVNALIPIALHQGYFASHGLDVTVQIYPSGKEALEGMLNGEVDVATASEYAFADSVLDGKNIRMIAVINRSSVEYLVGRPDMGVRKISDLKGKKVGVPMGSRPEFALGRFLYLNGFDPPEVTLVDVGVDQSVKALVSGKVEAVVTWQPYIEQIEDHMSDRTVAWSVQGGQPSYNGLVCAAEWTVAQPDLITSFLKSLVHAETYVLRKPEAVKNIIANELDYSEAYLSSVWPDHEFSVSLDESLITAMEDEVRWMIRDRLIAERPMPDFVEYVYEKSLKEVKPEAVNIIR